MILTVQDLIDDLSTKPPDLKLFVYDRYTRLEHPVSHTVFSHTECLIIAMSERKAENDD